MIPKPLGRSTIAASLAFVLALFLYEYFVLGVDQDRNGLLLILQKGLPLIFLRSVMLTIVSIGLTVLLVLLALRSGPLAKVAWFVLFALAVAVEYSHHAAFQRFSHYSTAAVGAFAGDLAFSWKAFLMYFSPLCLPPAIAFLILLVAHKRHKNKRSHLFMSMCAVIGFAVATAYFTTNRFVTVSPWAALRTAVAFPIVTLVGRQGTEAFGPATRNRVPVEFRADGRPANNIVLIVDESVRADHLSLNGYPRTAVPLLSRLAHRGELVNYGIAAAGSTCSSSANNLLLTGLIDLPDKTQKIYEMPTIFQYARAMNYRTYEFDGQVSSAWKGTVADLDFIQNRVTPVHLAESFEHPYQTDGEIARRVQAIVDGSVGNFIWINKRGVHKPYSDNFPNERVAARDSWWVGYDRRISTEQLIAGYDASIRYNLNMFFGRLLENGTPAANTLYIYTSDHGQSLREGGVQLSHCSSSRSEALVPLFIFGSGVASLNLDPRYRASHANIFPTLLDLMEVPQQARKYPYAISLLEARKSHSARRYYFDEDLTGEDGGRRYPFDP